MATVLQEVDPVVSARTHAPTRRADIQALRAVAVAAVVVYHLWPGLLPGGFVGVDVFFVISGYLIIGGLARELAASGTIRLGRFWARRAVRLLPASLTVLACTLLATWAWVPGTRWLGDLPEIAAATAYGENLMLIWKAVDYLAVESGAPSPVQHFWSLSMEEQFYILVPLLLWAAVRLGPGRARLPGARGRHVAGRRPALDAAVPHVAGAPATRTGVGTTTSRSAPAVDPCAARSARGARSSSATRAVVVILVLLAVASLASCLYLTDRAPATAYFATPSRMWEFAVGGLGAVGGRALTSRLPRRALAPLAWGGLGIVAASCLAIGPTTPFPGWIAAVPVTGALAVLVADGGLGRAAALRPVQLVGDASYSIYLWHWPVVVILPYALGQPLDTATRLVLVAAVVAVTWASTRWLEDPVRRRARCDTAYRRRVLVAVGIGGALVLAACGAGYGVMKDRGAHIGQEAVAAARERGECFGAPALGNPACATGDPGALVPDPALAPQDEVEIPGAWSQILPDGTASAYRVGDGRAGSAAGSGTGGAGSVAGGGPGAGSATPGAQGAGSTTGSTPPAGSVTPGAHRAGGGTGPLRVAAIGDSHNNSLTPAYAAAAEQLGWRIDVYSRSGCPWSTAPRPDPAERAECTRWRRALERTLDAGQPYDLILVTHREGSPVRAARGTTATQSAIDGQVAAWAGQARRGTRIVAITDVPVFPRDVVECVAVHGSAADGACAVPTAAARRARDSAVEAARATPGAVVIDMADHYCTGGLCPPVIGGVPVFSSWGHLGATFSASLGPVLAGELEAAATGE